VHAPQEPMPHPNFVPTNLRLSRNTQSSGVSAATSTFRALPFTLSVYTGMGFIFEIMISVKTVRLLFKENFGIIDF
jgi:hypothetical protein